jgi:hypothetical protein
MPAEQTAPAEQIMPAQQITPAEQITPAQQITPAVGKLKKSLDFLKKALIFLKFPKKNPQKLEQEDPFVVKRV